MANDYFDPTGLTVTNDTASDAGDINNLVTEAESAFDDVETDIDAHGVATTGVHGAGGDTIATDADITTHAALATGVHGSGGDTLATDADITTHAALTATHGVSGAIVGTSDSQTLTSKTLTAPVISTISNTGVVTLPTDTDTLVGRDTTDTLTNKTLTAPTITGASTLEEINGVTVGHPYRKNILINGNPSISQRGDYTSATALTNAAYYLDRWKTDLITITGTVQQVTTSQPSGASFAGSKSCKLSATSTSVGRIGAIQYVENYARFEGLTVTASAWVKSNSTNTRISLYDGVSWSESDAHTGGGAWEKLSITKTIGVSPTELAIIPGMSAVSYAATSITSGDYFEFTEAQLELGTEATAFEYRPAGEELALAQRYYYRISLDNSHEYGTAVGYNTTQAYMLNKFPVEMRTAPTALEQTGTASAYGLLTAGSALAFSSVPAFANANTKFARTICTVASGLTADNAYHIYTKTGATYLAWSAEL